jgi:hypothetical protein
MDKNTGRSERNSLFKAYMISESLKFAGWLIKT